jgi:hypothetical protein
MPWMDDTACEPDEQRVKNRPLRRVTAETWLRRARQHINETIEDVKDLEQSRSD